MIGITVTGSKQLDALFKALPDQMVKKVMRAALLKSGKPILVAAKKLVPVSKGKPAKGRKHLKQALAVNPANRRDERRGEIKVLVGARRAKPYKGFHAFLVEHGTKDRRTKKGAFRGRSRAQPFLGPAVKSQGRKQHQVLRRETAIRLVKLARKLVLKFGTKIKP